MFRWEDCWSAFIQALNLVILSSVERFQGDSSLQIPLHDSSLSTKILDYPIFEPPNAPEQREFICQYPEMPDYVFCSEHGRTSGIWSDTRLIYVQMTADAG